MSDKLPIIRYGKPGTPLAEIGRHFFDPLEQQALVDENQRIYDVYRRQPKRKACKNCGSTLDEAAFFKQDILYFRCDFCDHLNGEFEDTVEFYEYQFTENGGELTAGHYAAPDQEVYARRVDTIYQPKVEFLVEALRADGARLEDLSVADIGAGTGHFVKAMRDFGVEEVRGYEVSEMQVEAGNQMIGEPLLKTMGINGLDDLVTSVSAEVVTMVFVLEHLINPYETLKALKENPTIKYLLVAVPTHSPAAYVEMMFPTVYERHLAAHTHLYTDRSLTYLCDQIGLDRIGEWWFGADAMDLFRSVQTRMHQLGQPERAFGEWNDMIMPIVDNIQYEFDCRKYSSEVHLILKTGN